RAWYSGSVLHARGPRPLAAAADEPLPRAARRARLPDRPDRTGYAGALWARDRRRDLDPRAARERLSPRRRAPAPRRRRDWHRPASVPVGGVERASCDPRIPNRRARRGGGAPSGRPGCDRPDPRHGSDAGRTRRACLRPGAHARGGRAALAGLAARLGGGDGLRVRRLLRLRGRDRRRDQATLRRGTGARCRGGGCMKILNASGCLDALTAPEIAGSLDAFVTKTVTPLPREGNAPPRIAEVEQGMLNSIGLANPGIDCFVSNSL